MVENNNIDDSIVEEELKQLISNNIDTLVLGCTHFPLLKNNIKKFFKGTIITSSEGIIKELSYLSNNDTQGDLKVYTTGDNVLFDKKIKTIFEIDIKTEKIKI